MMEAATVPRSDSQTSPPSETEQAILAALTVVAMTPDLPEPDMLNMVEALLAPLGIAAQVARMAALLAFGGAVLVIGAQPGPASAQTARTVPVRRAAYLLSSARRIDQALNDAPRMLEAADALEQTGDTGQAAKLRDQAATLARPELAERRYLAQHLAAERARAQAAQRVDDAASVYGPLLGWRARMDDATTPACRAANGRNFQAGRPPTLPRFEDGDRVVGYPGTPHGGACRCLPGPPFPGGELLG